MTSQGSPYARFRRSLSTGNPLLVDAAARELAQISLTDALAIVSVFAAADDRRAQRAAVRWAARCALERSDVDLAALQEICARLADLPDPDAVEVLRGYAGG